MRYAIGGVLVTVLVATAFGVAGADDGRRLAGRNGGDASVVFMAHDYGFSGPDRIPAGITTVRVVNTGREPHHIQFLKLGQGKSTADFRAALAADPGRLPGWVQYAGGPNAHLPGSPASATLNLTEGNYVLICWIPDRNGVPHVALGMQKAVSVYQGKPTKVSQPKPVRSSLVIEQIDYQFVLSGPVQAGLRTIEVVNHGKQPHEVVVVKLMPGATVTDAIASFEPGASGPPRGELVSGITGIEQGDHIYFTGEFEPGRYGLICFLPDTAGGRPHFLQGMTAEFTVE